MVGRWEVEKCWVVYRGVRYWCRRRTVLRSDLIKTESCGTGHRTKRTAERHAAALNTPRGAPGAKS